MLEVLSAQPSLLYFFPQGAESPRHLVHLFIGEHKGKGPCANEVKKLNQRNKTDEPEMSGSEMRKVMVLK